MTFRELLESVQTKVNACLNEIEEYRPKGRDEEIVLETIHLDLEGVFVDIEEEL